MLKRYLNKIKKRKTGDSGQTLSQFLDAYGIKQKWLSNRLGISEGMLSLMLNNKRTWQHVHIENCANALGLNTKQVVEMVTNAQEQ